ncbi:hypothetical protein AXG93_1971s1050 [Marchantia polymorpha subsp. ruderalis]|uniref:N-acetyltransferase domain-containing protein n=1 Tax=Marchantia polymorpha subsp. ruderalis TaxID=1480154 RepID=A0A176WK97_MARPO|nr:hypothetical protein AXG93_1971s1050 [Marchantia polymorpha subsp. ruderalis]
MGEISDCREPSLPPESLILEGKRLVLKPPTAEDEGPMCMIYSDRITTKHLPQHHRPDGWTKEEMTERRRYQAEQCSQVEVLRPVFALVCALRSHPVKLKVISSCACVTSLFYPSYVKMSMNATINISYSRGKRIVFTIHLPENACSGGETSIVAGTAGLTLDEDSGEFGIILHHPFWKRGLCTEATYLCLNYAFTSRSIKRVDWVTAKDNAQMRGWCESLGLEAYDKEAPEMGESVAYSLTRSEWYNNVRHILEQRLS